MEGAKEGVKKKINLENIVVGTLQGAFLGFAFAMLDKAHGTTTSFLESIGYIGFTTGISCVGRYNIQNMAAQAAFAETAYLATYYTIRAL